MGMKGTIASAVTSAFNALGDLAFAATYVEVGDPTDYDPDSGVITPDNTNHALVQCVSSSFKNREIDGEIVRIGDKKLIFQSSELSVTPKLTDYVTISGENWDIIKITTPPGESIHILQIRKK